MGSFKKATKLHARLRLWLMGPGGSGKTWTALELASLLGSKVAVLDSEHGSASKYADKFAFDVMEPNDFAPETYIRAIAAAEREGYDVMVIDSLSHAWAGKGGILEQADRMGGRFDVWKNLTPQHNALLEAILAARLHVIATTRVKTEYVIEKNEKGKNEPRKVGLGAVQRDGLEYEFDVVASLALDNSMTIEKTRCPVLHGRAYRRENHVIADALKAWLTDGAPAPEPTHLEKALAASIEVAKTKGPANDGPKAEVATGAAAPAVVATAVETPDLDAVTVKKIMTLLGKLEIGVREANEKGLEKAERVDFLRDRRLEKVTELVGRRVTSTKKLTPAEATKVCAWADEQIRGPVVEPEIVTSAREKFNVPRESA